MAQEVRALEIPSKKVLGIPVSTLDMAGVLDVVREVISHREPHLIVTADANCLVLAHQDKDFGKILDRAALITADGSGVLWALRRKGVHLEQKVSGVDLAERLIADSSSSGYRIYLLGAEPGVAEEAARRMTEKYPGSQIVGFRHGFFEPHEEAGIAQEIAATRPDILMVAMGMPRQERFILAHQGTVGAPIGVGVGGTLDVFAGKAKRAPVLWQRLHLEWLWRTLLNPSKWSKLKNLPRFVAMVLRDKE